MDVHLILEQLKRRRQAVIRSIEALEDLARDGAPRRGRPPEWKRALNDSAPVRQSARKEAKARVVQEKEV